ncbi:transketolase family protein [Streptomyces sp. NPDC014894]|uniref:transketolase family protein n=1 Tax=Streptomyces sp. NPDC014894 TaxID=3364931 RepID=UPI0036FEAF86
MPVTAPERAEGPAPTAAEPEQPARIAYRDLLAALMPGDARLVCLDSDTGLFTGTDFGAAAERYINLGIAEQNLMGVAAAMARDGRIPFVNTMATFASSRAVEAVKLDIALNDVPVRIVATHAGLSAGHLGSTHHCLEDLAALRVLPNMTVLVPADAAQARELIRQSVDLPGPVYVRLGRHATPALAADGPPPVLGRAQLLRTGDDLLIVATGPYPVRLALDAAGELAERGVTASVLNVHTIKPFDAPALLSAAAGTRGIVTVEEHWRSGGLGSLVAETVSDSADPVRVRRIGVGDHFVSGNGDQRHLLEQAGVTKEAILAAAAQLTEPARQGPRPRGSERRGHKLQGGSAR